MHKAVSKILLAAGLFCAFVAQAATAPELAPDVLVKSVTQEVIAEIKKSGDDRDATKIARLVDAKVLPHFDFIHMTRLAMGRNWRLATPQQQQALVAEFRTLLVRTYSTSLTIYRDEEIEFEPLRAAPADTDVLVRSMVKKPGSESIRIDYRLEKTPSGWKIYNVTVGGISLVITYRSSFASQVHDNGVDGLIKVLADKNRANARSGA